MSRVFAAGDACMQGRRPTMEDAHTVITDAGKDAELGGDVSNMSVFIIFDGHAGSTCANLSANDLWKEIVQVPDIYKRAPSLEENTTNEEKDTIANHIITCVEDYDERLLERCRKENISDGCTMAGILVRNNDIFCFNSGDSRSVLGHWIPDEVEKSDEEDADVKKALSGDKASDEKSSESDKVSANERKDESSLVVLSKALSEDHKPTIPRELNRITRVGGRVSPTRMRLGGFGGIGGFAAAIGGAACGIPVEIPLGPDRVWPGGLALSRALGDLSFKDLTDEPTPEGESAENSDQMKELMESGDNMDNDATSGSLKKFGISHQLVVPTPDVTCVTLSDVSMDPERAKKYLECFLQTCSFLIVACDGLWDVMSSAEAADFTAAQIQGEIENVMVANKVSDITEIDMNSICDKVAQALVQEAFFRNSQDNISCIVVILKGQPATEEAKEEEEPEEEVRDEHEETPEERQEKIESSEENRDSKDEDAKERLEFKKTGDKFGRTISLYKYFNAKDPSEPAMLPEVPVAAAPIEENPGAWGIIALPYGMGAV